jgi:hypothetical protein
MLPAPLLSSTGIGFFAGALSFVPTMSDPGVLRRLRQTLELVQAGDTVQALAVLEATIAACADPAQGQAPLPDGVLPWLQLARTSLRGSDRTVPPFLALQTAIVLLEV